MLYFSGTVYSKELEFYRLWKFCDLTQEFFFIHDFKKCISFFMITQIFEIMNKKMSMLITSQTWAARQVTYVKSLWRRRGERRVAEWAVT